jgi:ELWxxDGT repeat protein
MKHDDWMKRVSRWGRLVLAASCCVGCGVAEAETAAAPHMERASSLAATGGALRLVDANPAVSRGLAVKSLVRLGDKVFFRGTTHDGAGTELWVTDGTAAGTHLFTDLRPGLPSSDPKNLRVEENRLYFVAVVGSESWLWESDGTPGGTRPVRKQFSVGEPIPTSAAVPFAGGVLQLEPAGQGAWLWRTAGTSGERVSLGAVRPREGAPFLGDWPGFELVTLGNQALMPGYHPDTGHQLWRSDGTPEGTGPLTQVQGPAGSSPRGLGTLNGVVLFTAMTPTSACALWRTEGTPESTRVVREHVCPTSTETGVLDTRLVFFNQDAEHGTEPWVTDGTPEGTHLLFDSQPGTGSGGEYGVATRLGPFVLLRAHGGLWRTDGTQEGSVRLAPFAQEHVNPLPEPVQFAVLGNRVLFPASGPGTGVELWSSDGTPEGTGMIADVLPGQDGVFPQELTVAGNRAYYFKGRALWSTDGTETGTARIEVETAPNQILVTVPDPRFTAIGETVYFRMSSATESGLLFKTVPGGKARRVGDFTKVDALFAVNGTLLFTVQSGTRWELWRSRGTAESTTRVGEVHPSPSFMQLSAGAAQWSTGSQRLGGLAFFPAVTEAGGSTRLWRTDGTVDGTLPLDDVAPRVFFGEEPAGAWRYARPAVLGAHGQWLFAGADAAGGLELWATNGSPGDGTYRVQDLSAGAGGGTPEVLVVTPRGVLLSAHDAEAGTEPWWLPLPAPPQDVTPPVVSCPEDFRVESQDGQAVEVAFPDVRATDDQVPAPRLDYSVWPGAVLAVGGHRVDVVATDVAGNTASCSFQVNVESVAPESPEDKDRGCAAGPGGLSAALLLAWPGLARRRGRGG